MARNFSYPPRRDPALELAVLAGEKTDEEESGMRLTERDEYGNADIIGVDGSTLQGNLEFDELNLVTNALNKLADYEEREPATNWTPCAEGLPTAQTHEELLTKPTQYIVDVVFGDSARHIVTTLAYGKLNYCGKVGWINTDEYYCVGDSGYDVLAWQPLPQPWTGEKKGENE